MAGETFEFEYSFCQGRHCLLGTTRGISCTLFSVFCCREPLKQSDIKKILPTKPIRLQNTIYRYLIGAHVYIFDGKIRLDTSRKKKKTLKSSRRCYDISSGTCPYRIRNFDPALNRRNLLERRFRQTQIKKLRKMTSYTCNVRPLNRPYIWGVQYQNWQVRNVLFPTYWLILISHL